MRIDPSEELVHLKLLAAVSGIEVADFTFPEERDVVLGGLRIHYLDWGTIGKPPLVFLHGGALTARTWDAVCLAMRSHCRCLALDQRGHGDSEWSPVMDYAPETHARDVERFADHFALDRFVLIGQSMGGLNAFAYAAQHSHRLAALVIIDTGPSVRISGAQKIMDFVGSTLEADSLDALVEQALVFNPRRDPRLLRGSLRRNMRQLPDGRWVRKHDSRWGRRGPSEILEVAAVQWRKADAVRCPVLVVRGAASDVFLDEDAESFARSLADGRWRRVESAGHNVQGDNPRGLVAALDAFLTEVL